MSHRDDAEKENDKFDSIYRDQLINMLVSYILKHTKKLYIGLSNYLSNHENDSMKDN